MKIYIYINGHQQGPYHRDELVGRGITPQTPVWYSGLGSWTPAGQAECTRWLFDPALQGEIRNLEQKRANGTRMPGVPGDGPSVPPYPGAFGGGYNGQTGTQHLGQPAYYAKRYSEPRPADYMTYAVITLILAVVCANIISLIFSIIAMVKGSEVGNAYQREDYDRARACSRQAKLYSTISLVITLVLIALVIIGWVLSVVYMFSLPFLMFY